MSAENNWWSSQILDHHLGLQANIVLPGGVEWIYPFEHVETVRCMREFYAKYYSDNARRVMLLGINPGRFGAGVTGVPFTDPVRLREDCGIENNFAKRAELSSTFVYEFIHALGGPASFYSSFYIASVCPLGFVRDGKNYNYYDSKDLEKRVFPLIVDNIEAHLKMPVEREVVLSIGKGKNYKFLKDLNDEMGWFGRVLALPHPRWVMQYRLQSKDEHVNTYTDELTAVLGA